MRGDRDATRQRILGAARAEFAEFGLAGARVDRIAARASASKERLYAYFGDKESLFLQVLEDNLADVVAAVPLDPDDLSTFVGGLFDHALAHPDHVRMMDWARLEWNPERAETIERSRPEHRDVFAESLAEAQARGTVDAAWDVDDLLTLLFAIATASAHRPPFFTGAAGNDEDSIARRRAAAITAARNLLGARGDTAD